MLLRKIKKDFKQYMQNMKELYLHQLLVYTLSKILMKKMELKGVEFAETTLHIGLGTFYPILVEDLSKHKMESEQVFIPVKAAEQINTAEKENKKYAPLGQV